MIINVPDRRDEGETDLRKTQLVMLKLLNVLDTICIAENLNYWLDCGSLLGAVRHKGFIPWDDDLDVAMPRMDYDKFVNVASKYLPEDIFLQTKQTDPGYPWGYMKLRDKYSTYIESREKENEHSYHRGIFLDIFPMDYINSSYKKVFFWMKLASNGRFYSRLPYSIYIIQKILHYTLRLTIGKKGIKYLQNRVLHFCRDRKIPRDLCTYGLEVPIKHFLELGMIYPLKSIEFEENRYPCPGNPHYYLTILYGTYSELPPDDKRQIHATTLRPYQPCNHPEVLNWR